MSADQTSQLLAAYFAGDAELEPVAVALVDVYRAHGWGFHLDFDELRPEQHAAAGALVARCSELFAASRPPA